MGFCRASRSRATGLSATVVAFLLVFIASFAFGQGIVTGSISGTVVDPQKAVVSGASITVTNVGTNAAFTGTSNPEGIFSLRSLPVGTYRLSIEAQGFAKLQVGEVVV